MRRLTSLLAMAGVTVVLGQPLVVPAADAVAVTTAHVSAGVASAHVASVKTYSYGRSGHHRYDVYRTSTAGRRPAVVVVHGGGWTAGDKKNRPEVEMARRFVSAGYTAINVNYRLVEPGRVTLNQTVSDVVAAVDHIRARAAALGIDKNRIAVVGSSAGGHLAMMVGTLGRGADRVRAVVASAGMPALQMQNDKARYGGGKASWLRKKTLPQGGLTTEQWYQRIDPYTNAGAGDARLLWIGATRDTYLHPELGWQLAEKLRAGKVSAKVIVPDAATHTLLVGTYQHRKALWRHVLAWVGAATSAKVPDGSTMSATLAVRRSGSSVVVTADVSSLDTGDSAPFGAPFELHVARRDGGALGRYVVQATGRLNSGREKHQAGVASVRLTVPEVRVGDKVKLVIRGNGAPTSRSVLVR